MSQLFTLMTFVIVKKRFFAETQEKESRTRYKRRTAKGQEDE
jgi:hypothetical protein